MKTLLLYNSIEEEIKSTILVGDYSRFNGICINSMKTTGYEEEFIELFWDREGNEKLRMEEGTHLIESKEWDKVAIVTCLP